jgi:ornithine cyclodeaminase
MRLVSRRELESLVTESLALESARRAFTALGRDEVRQPFPMSWRLDDGELHAKGAALDGSPIFALKMATGFGANADAGLPTGSGVVIIFDRATGHVLGVLADDGYLTDMRTAAAVTLAVLTLKAPTFRKLAIIGAGVQARFITRALAQVVAWDEGAAWSRRQSRCEAFCAEASTQTGLPLSPASTVANAVQDADIIITCTAAASPLIEPMFLKPGSLIVAIGADSPGKQELDPSLLALADHLIVDIPAQALALGECQHAIATGLLGPGDVEATLGHVLTGRHPGRVKADDRIVCDLTGTGAQDAAIAELVWSKLTAPRKSAAPRKVGPNPILSEQVLRM